MWTDIQIDRQTNRQIDRQTDRQTDRHTDRQTDRQTNHYYLSQINVSRPIKKRKKKSHKFI